MCGQHDCEIYDIEDFSCLKVSKCLVLRCANDIYKYIIYKVECQIIGKMIECQIRCQMTCQRACQNVWQLVG